MYQADAKSDILIVDERLLVREQISKDQKISHILCGAGKETREKNLMGEAGKRKREKNLSKVQKPCGGGWQGAKGVGWCKGAAHLV